MKNSGLMEEHLVHDLANKEKFYWWHRVRRNNLIKCLKKHFPEGGQVLEIGSGTGENLRAIQEHNYQVAGLELDGQALKYCQNLSVVKADAMGGLPYQDASFDAVVILDVLEHLNDPQKVIEEIWRVLNPRGVVVVMVPSDPKLWSYWDEMAGHCRRYTPESLKGEFSDQWDCLKTFHTFSWMYWPVKIFRKLKKSNNDENHSDFIEFPKWINESLVFCGKVESWLEDFLPIPIGTTVAGVWKKNISARSS